MNKGLNVLDGKAIVGAGATVGASVVVPWVEAANAYGQLVLTAVGIVVGIVTLWYTVERAKNLRRNRLEAACLNEREEK